MRETGSRNKEPQCASTIFMSFSMVGKRLLFTRCRKSLTCHPIHLLNDAIPGFSS